VKITTPSTNSLIPILERQKVNEYMANMTGLANLASTDQTGELMTKLKEQINFGELMSWMNDAYGIDQNGLKADTKKDEIKKENMDKLQKMKDFLTASNQPNALTMGQDPQIPSPTTQPTG